MSCSHGFQHYIPLIFIYTHFIVNVNVLDLSFRFFHLYFEILAYLLLTAWDFELWIILAVQSYILENIIARIDSDMFSAIVFIYFSGVIGTLTERRSFSQSYFTDWSYPSTGIFEEPMTLFILFNFHMNPVCLVRWLLEFFPQYFFYNSAFRSSSNYLLNAVNWLSHRN